MKNDSNQTEFDIAVIGAGAAGLNVASFMRAAGFTVLLVSRTTEDIGGDCLNFGCIPSKALIHVARTVAAGNQAQQFGCAPLGVVDIGKVMTFVREKQEQIRKHENIEFFTKKGIHVAIGAARFVDERTLLVGDSNKYRAKKYVLATGSRPRTFDIPGLDTMTWYTNETIFSLTALPPRLVVVGGGPIGVELGQAFAMLGSHVTIVAPDFLAKEDPDISAVVRTRMEAQGVVFRLGSLPVEARHNTLVVARGGVREELPADALLVSIGRVLNTEGLGLEEAGVRQDARGVPIVDEYLRTTNPRIFALGDIAGGPMFTHTAEHQMQTLAFNLFSPFKKRVSYDTLAWVTYTTPEIATFGHSAKTLQERGVRHETLMLPLTDDDRAIVTDTTEGLLKVHVSPSGVVLGGTVVAENAGELVQELILVQTYKLSLAHLARKVYPYPTATRINRTLALQYRARSLTSRVKALMRFLYR